jgi:hypothetical protein
MADAPLPTRRYNEKSTDAILRRAAELQASGGVSGIGERGLTLTEMEAIAQEAGIDPALIRRAATEVDQRAAAKSSPFLGAPLRLGLERVIPGALTDEAWGTMVLEVQSTLGPGHSSQVGRLRTWSVIGPGGRTAARPVSISATVQQDRTVFRADESQSPLAGGLFGGLMGGLGGGGFGMAIGIGIGTFNSPLIATALAVAVVSGSYLLARTIFTYTVRHRAAQLNALLDRMAGMMPPSPPP